MVGTLKKALQKVVPSESKESVASLENVLHVYRHRLGPEGVANLEILFGVNARFAIESSDAVPGEEVLATARPFELAIALVNRAERLVAHTFLKRVAILD